MKCPVCGASMASMVCSCGYDESRNYEKYPVFGRLYGNAVSVAGLRDRRKNLIRCGGCGNHGFSLNVQEKMLCCLRCGRALTEAELKPLVDALGMKKAESTPVPEKQQETIVVQADEKSNAARLSEFGNLLNVLKSQAAGQDNNRQNHIKKNQTRQIDPKRIVSIAGGYEHTVALYADGTVAAVGSNFSKECDLADWRDIVAISAGYHHTTGLKKDGTVVVAGNCYGNQKDAEKWEDIIAIADGTFHTVGLKKDGTVVAAGDKSSGKCNVSGWSDIVAIAAGDRHTLAQSKSGAVFAVGKGKGAKLPLDSWNQVKAFAAGYSNSSAALTENGSVLIAGDGGNPVELGRDNVELGVGFAFTVVRKADGTAAASGYNPGGRFNVRDWTDLEMIAVGRVHAVGLKKNGDLVATGKNSKGQCDVHKLVRK